jgi:dihydroxyacetone kinase
MAAFGAVELKRGVARALSAMQTLEQELNAADAKLGDGDTGGMLGRVIGAMAKTEVTDASDLGTAFTAYARAAMAATGSSLGTLFATALMVFARETKGRQRVEWSELGGLLAKARDAMIARGGANLGDKTVLDGLDAVSSAILEEGGADAVASKAVAAGRRALDEFRQRPNKIGRARMFAEATVGLDDPGMLALVKLSEALAAH